MIFDHAAATPDALALDDLTRQRTWAEFADRSTRLAHVVRRDLDVRPDQHVAILMGNRVEYIEIVLGAIMAGVWITPVNRHLRVEEIAYVCEDSGARVVFTDPEHEATARQAARAPVVVVGDDLDRMLAGTSDAPMARTGPAGATMIYTSGTTGRPKGVRRTRPPNLGAALAAAATTGAGLGLDGSGAHLVTGPLHHAAPLLFALYDQANGAPVVIMPHWDAGQALHLLQARRIRHTHMVPTMFVRLLRLDEQNRRAFDRSALRLVLHGAAPIAPSIKRRMLDWWGDVLVEYWGGTEGGVCTLVSAADWLAHPGTVGRATPAFEVFAVDEAGTRLPAGATGVLYCRHQHLARVFEYHRSPDKTAAAHPAPGVFTTGDIGYVDQDGYVYLCDRQCNMIISGGVNIYPAEVEQVLQQHPAVVDVAVFGIPDDEWGEVVKAAIELEEGRAPSPQLESEILAFARQHLAGYKVPRSIDFERALPRHPTGKLYTRLLRDRYWHGRTRRI